MDARTCGKLEQQHVDLGLVFIDSEYEGVRYALDSDRKAVAVLVGGRLMILKPAEIKAIARELPEVLEVYFDEQVY